MRPLRPAITLFAVVQTVAVAPAIAQPNLPPPPPPPIGEPIDLPPPAPSPRSPEPPQPAPSPPQRRASPPPAPAPVPPPYHSPRHRRTEAAYVEEGPRPAPPAARDRETAITLDPVALGLGRLSGNVEVLVAPHHAFVASPNVLLLHFDRGGRYSLLSEGAGFATSTSNGFGVEFGYHYFWDRHNALRGLFFGPSLLLGGTTDASVGDPSHLQAYWGLALDIGEQEVLSGGFTIGAGVGLGLLRMADATAVFPRLLLQVGWSF